MATLLLDNTYRERVVAKRDFYINKYSWNSVASRIEAVINQDTLN
jgi:hypothetical protein